MLHARAFVRALAAVAACGALLVAATARADLESPLVKEGLAAYAAADYARAVTLLDQARQESLTREEKVATYHALGLGHAALGDETQAREAFQRLLRLEPGFQLDRSVAPKTRALFEEAKARAATSGSLASGLPAIEPTLTPAQPRAGRAVTLHVGYRGGAAQKMVVYYRHAGERAWGRVTVDGKEGEFEAIVPGLQTQAPALEYHVALLDDAGAAVAAAGTLGQPLSVDVAPERRPVYKRAWFWGVVGGVVAAGAVATALALALPRPTNAPVTVVPQ